MTSHLEILARRADEDPFFLGCLLQHYAKSEKLSDEQLAGALGCKPDTLVLLRLCRAPAAEAAEFQKGIDEIATRFEVKPDVLAEAVRRGQTIIQLALPGGNQGLLAAARDMEREPKNERH